MQGRSRACGVRGPGRSQRRAAAGGAAFGRHLPSGLAPGQGLVAPTPEGGGTITAEVHVAGGGEHELWLGGSVVAAAEVWIGGRKAGEVRHELNNLEQYVRLGSAELEPGTHTVELRFGGADLHPGSAAGTSAVGPLVVAPTTDPQLVNVDAGDARSLCGTTWDWIEVAS